MSTAPINVSPDREQIRRALEAMHAPDSIVELRALHKGRKRTDAGYFDGTHREQMIEEAVRLNAAGAAVYVTMNRLDPQLLARHANRVQEFAPATATDNNIERREWLLVDIDPQRPKDTSATDEQLEAAKSVARSVFTHLKDSGWPEPVSALSGNGCHLYYRLNLPNDEPSRDLVKHCLEALATRFDTDGVKIDRSVYNAARITKLLGTVATKGDNVASAPWRLSKIVKAPKTAEPVSTERLSRLAAEVAPGPQSLSGGLIARAFSSSTAWDERRMAEFLAKGGIEAAGPEAHDGSQRWKLKRCPFNEEHVNGEAAVFIISSGALVFKCQHNSCADNHWKDLRELVDGPRESRTTYGAADERQSSNRSENSGQRQSHPEPLRRPLPPADAYPMHALGPILGAAAQRVHEVVQAPAAMCGQSFLAAASLVAQAHANVEIDGRRELLSLFALTVAESGERKSAVDRLALQAHREHERLAISQYDKALIEHELLVTVYEAKRRLITKAEKGATPESIEDALRDLKAPKAPVNPIFLAPTPTLEGLHKLYACGRPSIGLFHDDAGEFIGGHAMSDDNRMKSAAGLSRLWDFGEFDRIRAGDGAHKFYGRRLALHLMMQPVIAESVLSDEVLTGQGLLARTLMVWPGSTIGDRPYVEIDLTSDLCLTRYRHALDSLLQLQPHLRGDSENELDPPVLLLSQSAKRAWVAVHNAIETDQKDGGAWASVRPWASKAPAQVLRIAGVLNLIENPAARQIESEYIERAAALAEHHLSEAVRIVGTASVPAEIRNAEALRDWCHREGMATLHSQAALQFGPGRIRTVAVFDSAIAVLERTGWAARIEGGCELDGKHRRRAWTISKAAP